MQIALQCLPTVNGARSRGVQENKNS